MKIQDIAFIIVFLIVILLRNPRIAAGFGIICLIFAIPLFAFWVFFTAERLVWYAAAFFILSAVFLLNKKK